MRRVIAVGTVERPMTHRDDPRSFGAMLRHVRFLQNIKADICLIYLLEK